jgi:hypothetical protein
LADFSEPAPAVEPSVRWIVDGRELAGDFWVCTAYMNRGQERNLRGEGITPRALQIRVARPAFERMMSPFYEQWVREERDDIEDDLDADSASGRVRALGFPPFAKLLAKHADAALAWVVEWEADVMERLWTDEGAWKTDAYFVHQVTSARLDGGDVVLEGVALHAAAHNAVRLRNLLRTLQDDALVRDQPALALESIAMLARGGRHALAALPVLDDLARAAPPPVAAEARSAAEAIRRTAGGA